MRYVLPLLLLFACGAHAGPLAALDAALEDAAGLKKNLALDVIYFWQPGGFTGNGYAAAAMHCNLLSREGDLTPPRIVQKDLIAVYRSDYGWDAKTFEKLAGLDPYFHQNAIVPAGSLYSMYWRGSPQYAAGWYRAEKAKTEIKIAIPAKWLPAKKIEALYELTNSNVPLLRWDWFFNQTAVCEDRQVGYYEILGIKNRKDAEELAGLNRKLADQRRKVQMAYLRRSGVAVNNRAIEWNQAYDGDWWFTKDVFKDIGENNVVRLLNGDLQHAAEEIYFSLPNGLPGMIACNQKGELQRVVPSKIAANKHGMNNDLNIHIPLNCMQCHVEVIRPFNDDARNLYRDKIVLESPDYVKYLRLKRLYLTDIDTTIQNSQRRFALAIKACNGLTPAANAEAYAETWSIYLERPLGLAEAAAELGTTQERLLKVVGAKVAAGLSDPVLSGLWNKNVVPVRREHWEELQGVIWDWLEYTP